MSEPFCPYPIIAGPTASGKTALAIMLAQELDGEVVSADSMQVYGGISVGTARPDAEEMAGIPHHLLGYVPLDEAYSVVRYLDDAKAAFADICSRGKLPVMCGGTGLYVRSFMENIRYSEDAVAGDTREQLNTRLDREGGAALLRELAAVDPVTASRLHENDSHRIVRALEVYYTTGRTISEQVTASHTEPSPYTGCLIVLNYRIRSRLYERIDRRVDGMLERGLVAEAERVLSEKPGATVLQAIGYKELLPYLQGKCSLDEAAERIKLETHHLAKRQLTWFCRMPQAQILYVDDYETPRQCAGAAMKIYRDFCERRGTVEQ